jgi:anaerobic selenocysteine-containing dehydrogenase
MTEARTALSACTLCEALCGIQVTVRDREVLAIKPDPDDPLSRGHICPKAVALQDIYTDPDRLRRPVRRTADGWQEMEWDEAFDFVADRLVGIRKRHGRDAIGLYIGNPTVHSLGGLTHGLPFTELLDTRSRFSATSVDQLPHQFVNWQLFGHQFRFPIPDIDRTQYFLMFGANPMASNGSIMTVPGFAGRVKDLQARDGKLVIFDPRRNETARVADEHHFIRPGTDAAVLLAMVNVLFADGLVRPANYVDNLDQLRSLTVEFTPDWAAAASGVPADTIRRIAREFAGSPAAVAYGRTGVSTQQFGALAQWAIQLLNILTGNLDRAGGAMFTTPAADVTKGLGAGHYDAWRSRVRGVPEFSGELPVSVLAEEIETAGDGQIRALVTVAGNPVLSTPDGATLDRALDTLDFMVSVDIYINETTRHADVILPPTVALERDHYDLIFHLLAVHNTARFNPAVFPRSDDARHDWEIFRGLGVRLARKTALGGGSPRQRLAAAAKLATLLLNPTQLVDVLLRTGRHRISLKKLKLSPHGLDLGPLQPSLPGALATKNKRIDLIPKLLVDDLPRLEKAIATGTDGLVLVGRRHLRSNNSWMHNSQRLVKGKPRHQLLMNPADLAERGIADGSRVRVSARAGSVEVEAVASDEMMPGVVSLPHGWGHHYAGVQLSVASKTAGVSANDLTDRGLLDERCGTAALNGVPVAVTPIPELAGEDRTSSAAPLARA